MKLFVIAQIMGAFGALAMMLSSWQKSRKRIFAFLVFDNIFYFLQYIFLEAYSGAFTNVVGLFRTILFSKKGKNKFLSTNYPLIIVLVLYVIINIFTYDGLTSLFPAIASIIYAVVLWQDDPKRIRIGSAVMLLMWFVYNLYVKAYVGALTEFTLFTSAVIAIIKIDIINPRKEKKAELEEKESKKKELKSKKETKTNNKKVNSKGGKGNVKGKARRK